MSQLLVVGDTASSFATIVRRCGYGPEAVSLRSVSWSAVRREPSRLQEADLLLLVAPGASEHALHFLAWLRSEPQHPPVLAVLPVGVEAALLDAAARTAEDFILWDHDRTDELGQRIGRVLGSAEHKGSISRRLARKLALATLVGETPAFLAVVAKIPLVARTETPLVILGETGTGKELCARAVHHLGRRGRLPFIPVDCGALPDHLVENELFGHARGAFTDAHRDQSGLVAMAEGGTLFLDEVDSLTPSSQAKLLRLLQERTYKPLGSDRFVHADIRIMAATNLDLEELVHRKLFRSDLYFRLSVLTLTLPSLRERPEDIALLARHFVDRCCSEARLARKTLAPEAIERLARASWPGNVRELCNVIQRAVVFCEGAVIRPSHLSMPDEPSAEPEPTGGFREARARALDAFARSYLESLLRKHRGNVTRSAREAKQDRRAFGRLIKKYRIDRLAP